MKIRVYHSYYSCDTGCCGHTVEIDGYTKFSFEHPNEDEDKTAFAKNLARKILTERFGKKHTFDLDWGNCDIQLD